MNDAKFSYNFFAKKNTTDVNNSISALPEGLPKKNFTAPNAAVYDSDKKNTTVQSDNEKIVDEIQNNHNRIRSLIKLAVIGAAITILIIISTIAWFTMNREVENNGLSMTATDAPFEIGVVGTTVRNNSELNKADNQYNNGDNTQIAGYYITDGLNSKIKIRYTPSQGDIEDFGPGSSGVLSFYVIPKQDGDLTVKIDLGSIGYREYDYNNTKIIKPISELTTTNSSFTQDDINQFNNANNFLQGHILFFENPGDTTNANESLRYYYQNPITSRTINKTFLNARKDVPQQVTIYWMWANTLGQIALKNNNSGFRNGYPLVQDVADDVANFSSTDKGKMVQYLKNNKSIIFNNASSISDADIDDASTKATFSKLSTGYNEADFLMGFGLSYFMIEISVDTVS